MAGTAERARAPQDEGFTLAEVVVALMLFAVLGAAAAGGLVSALRASKSSEARVLAANLATRQMEAAWGLAADAVLDRTDSYTLDGRTFTVRQTATFDTVRAGTGSACDGASGPAAFKRVSVVVTWVDMDGVEPVRSDSVRSLPVTGSTATTGVLTVPVRDRNGAPLAGQTVTVTNGTSSATATTRADGCAVFPGLAPSTSYVASVNTPGYVGVSGTQLAGSGSPVSVEARVVTKAPAIRYDRPAALRLTLTAPPGYPPLRTAAVVSSTESPSPPLAVPGCGTPPCATSEGPEALTVGGLFPFSAGYTTWFCGATPAAQVTPVAPGATASAPVVGTGGVSAVVGSLAAPVPGRTVYAVSPSCPDQPLPFPTASSAAGTRAALPPGTWRLVTDPAAWATSGRYAEVAVAAGQTMTSPVEVPA